MDSNDNEQSFSHINNEMQLCIYL